MKKHRIRILRPKWKLLDIRWLFYIPKCIICNKKLGWTDNPLHFKTKFKIPDIRTLK